VLDKPRSLQCEQVRGVCFHFSFWELIRWRPFGKWHRHQSLRKCSKRQSADGPGRVRSVMMKLSYGNAQRSVASTRGNSIVAKRTYTEPQPATLSMEQVRAAIPRLERRLAELEGLDLETLTDQNDDAVLGDLVRRIDDTLMNIYGSNTKDYHRYCISSLDDTPILLGGGWPSVAQRRPAIRSAVMRAISTLQSAISILKERLNDASETAGARAVKRNTSAKRFTTNQNLIVPHI
jgi:hypothetical protein